MRRDSCEDVGRPLDLEVKKSSMIHTCQGLNRNGTPWQHKCYFLQVSVLWVVEFWKRKKNKNTIHFTAETSNIELLFRMVHSASQLSIFGAVSSWCGDSLVQRSWSLFRKDSSQVKNPSTRKRWRMWMHRTFGSFGKVYARPWKQGARWSWWQNYCKNNIGLLESVK